MYVSPFLLSSVLPLRKKHAGRGSVGLVIKEKNWKFWF